MQFNTECENPHGRIAHFIGDTVVLDFADCCISGQIVGVLRGVSDDGALFIGDSEFTGPCEINELVT